MLKFLIIFLVPFYPFRYQNEIRQKIDGFAIYIDSKNFFSDFFLKRSGPTDSKPC